MTDQPYPTHLSADPDDIFLVNPDNEPVLRGESRDVKRAGTPAGSSVSYIGLIGIVIAIVALFVFQNANQQTTTIAFLVGVGLLFATAMILGRRQMAQQESLTGEGEIVQGEITKMNAGTRVDKGEAVFVLDMRYRFTTPGGKQIEQRVQRFRDDLRDEPLPEPGDPVAVLVVNEGTHQIL